MRTTIRLRQDYARAEGWQEEFRDQNAHMRTRARGKRRARGGVAGPTGGRMLTKTRVNRGAGDCPLSPSKADPEQGWI